MRDVEPAAETQLLTEAEDAELPMPLPQLASSGRPRTREIPLGRIAGARSGDKGGEHPAALRTAFVATCL